MKTCVNGDDQNLCLGFAFNHSCSLTNENLCVLILHSNNETHNDDSALNSVFIQKTFTLKYDSCESLKAGLSSYFQSGVLVYQIYSRVNPKQRYALCNQIGEGEYSK